MIYWFNRLQKIEKWREEKMPINRRRLLHLKKCHVSPNNPAHTDSYIKNQLSSTLHDTQRKVENVTISEAIEYTLWNDLWNDIGIFGTNKDKMIGDAAKDRYSRGQKVFVNLGYNVGKEASMPHPAIIVKNFRDLAIVVTTTSDDGTNLGELEDMVIHCPKDGKVFPNNDIVELHQIRCIGKNRIIRNLNQNVKDYILPDNQVDQLNKIIEKRLSTIGVKLQNPVLSYGTDLRTIIDIMISFHYAPDTFNDMVMLKSNVEKLEKDKQDLTEKLESLTEELEWLKNEKKKLHQV
jgi:mRNA-degrading endonuclease toxin of MazEF toxin-antitoxin module